MLFKVAISLLLFQTAPATAPRSETGTIEGVVIQDSTGTPLVGARVILTRATTANGAAAPIPAAPPLTSAAGAGVATQSIAPLASVNSPNATRLPSATTDGKGRYIINDVDPGNYRVTFAASGFVKQDYGQRSFSGPGIPIAVTTGKAIKDIDMLLTPAGNLSGRVRDAAGVPAAGVQIQLLRVTYNASGKKGFRLITSDKTDDRGEYRLYWLTPGRYYLTAGTPPGPSDRPVASIGGGVSPNQVPGENFAYTFYPGVPNADQAVPIDIPAGGEVQGIDFTVRRQQQLNVRGKAIDSRTGLPPTSVNISVSYQTIDGGGTFGAANYNTSTGTFELTSINPGSYTIVATVQEGNQPNSFFDPAARPPAATAAQPIDLVNGDIENVVLNLETGSPLSGRVIVDGIQPTSLSAIRVQLNPTVIRAIAPIVGFNSPQVPATNQDGTFRFDAVNPGNYRVAVTGLPPQYYLKEAQFHQTDALNQPIHFSSGDTASLDIVMSSGAVQIDGAAIDEKLRTIPGVVVVLVPDQHRDRFELFKNTTTDPNGRYILRGIAPGDYKLFAWDSLDPFAWFDPEIIRRDESNAKTVHILEGSNQAIDVKIIYGQ